LGITDNTNDDDLKILLAEEEDDINLIDAENLTPTMCQKKIMMLLKIRRLMKENMQVSGTHSHTPLNFLDVAINKTKGGRMFHRLGVYYFYIRASEYDALIDAAFEPFLSEDHKGSTAPEVMLTESESSGTEDTTGPIPKKRQGSGSRTRKVIDLVEDEDRQQMASAITAIACISENSTSMAVQMKRAVDLEEKKVSMEELRIKVELAKALGQDDVLRQLLNSMTTGDS
jgi:hypothetical protein